MGEITNEPKKKQKRKFKKSKRGMTAENVYIISS